MIIVVLLLDLGLAGAGVYLLTEGLAAGDVTNEAPAPGSAAKTGSAESKPAPRAVTEAPKPQVAATPPAPVAPVAPTPPPEDPGSAKPAAGSGSSVTQGRKPPVKPRAPIDPYPDPPSSPPIGPPPPPPGSR